MDMIAWCSGVLIKDGVYFVFGGTLLVEHGLQRTVWVDVKYLMEYKRLYE
jgi:hypothetical protein